MHKKLDKTSKKSDKNARKCKTSARKTYSAALAFLEVREGRWWGGE